MKRGSSIKERCILWVWRHTPNCAEMSRLASRRLDQGLPWRIRLQMRLHFVICVWCRRYFKQLDFLHRQAPRSETYLAGAARRGLSPEAKERIVQRLRT
jgi:hypothetical protein